MDFLQKSAQPSPLSPSRRSDLGSVVCYTSRCLGHGAFSDRQEVAAPQGHSRGKMAPTTGPGGDLDRKVMPSMSPVPSVPEGRQTKRQGPPLALLIAC